MTWIAKLADEQEKNAGLLNFLAHQMANDKDNPKPNLDLAEKLAERANKAADGKDSSILDTQARILFLKGQKRSRRRRRIQGHHACRRRRRENYVPEKPGQLQERQTSGQRLKRNDGR